MSDPGERVAPRRLMGLAVPALGVLAAEPLYVLVDTAVVGHLGAVPLAGLALGGTLFTLVSSQLTFLTYGTTARTSRLHGAGRRADAVAEGVQATWLGVGVGVALLLLAQLLRAYGTPARHVTCLPYQDVFRDCHVVVEAYWREQGQWVMLDPTYCLAVRDGTGRWLSLWDLRKAIEQGGALVPRETICYNGGPYTMEEYRAYMAKNLFRFALVKELVHGGDGEQTLLEPRGYSSELVPQQERSHSAAAFWAAP